MPCCIALLALPLGVAAAFLALKHYDDPPRLVPAQGLNVALVIVTDLLLALAYFIVRAGFPSKLFRPIAASN